MIKRIDLPNNLTEAILWIEQQNSIIKNLEIELQEANNQLSIRRSNNRRLDDINRQLKSDIEHIVKMSGVSSLDKETLFRLSKELREQKEETDSETRWAKHYFDLWQEEKKKYDKLINIATTLKIKKNV